MRNAKSFVEYYKKESLNGKKYLFLLKANEKVVAGLDLQVANKKVATIGFWQDFRHSGYITNAVLKLLDIAKSKGFKKLDGYVDLDNEKAIRVLKRAGFSYKGVVKGKTRKLKKFERKVD